MFLIRIRLSLPSQHFFRLPRPLGRDGDSKAPPGCRRCYRTIQVPRQKSAEEESMEVEIARRSIAQKFPGRGRQSNSKKAFLPRMQVPEAVDRSWRRLLILSSRQPLRIRGRRSRDPFFLLGKELRRLQTSGFKRGSEIRQNLKNRPRFNPETRVGRCRIGRNARFRKLPCFA